MTTVLMNNPSVCSKSLELRSAVVVSFASAVSLDFGLTERFRLSRATARKEHDMMRPKISARDTHVYISSACSHGGRLCAFGARKRRFALHYHSRDIPAVSATRTGWTMEQQPSDGAGGGNGLYSAQRNLSKQQLKKLQKQREREMLIQQARDVSESTTSQKTDAAFRKKLRNAGFEVHDIPSDGNCMFKAIQHQLEIAKDREESAIQHDHHDLRLMTAKLLLECQSEFLPFFFGSKETEIQDEYAAHCYSIRDTAAWGGELELCALCRVLGRTIFVHSDDSREYRPELAETYLAPLHVSFHRHLYAAGAHYNSLVPLG